MTFTLDISGLAHATRELTRAHRPYEEAISAPTFLPTVCSKQTGYHIVLI